MTPRERVLTVLRGEVPDRVPVMPGYGTWYGARVTGCDLFDLEEGQVHAGALLASITRKYGAETWYWQGYIDDLPEVGNDGQGEITVTRLDLDADNYQQTLAITTPLGRLSMEMHHNRYNPEHQISGFIKDPERDWPIYREFRGDRWQWETQTTIGAIPEHDLDLGVTSFCLLLPVDFWKNLRCDTAAAVMDLYDGDAVIEEAVAWHTEYCAAQLQARLQLSPLPDMIHLQGSSSSLSVISPDVYRQYNPAFINRICDLAHAAGVPVQVHHCGKSGKLVEILAEETAVDLIHPLESAPGGDVNLHEVKRRYGHRIVLMGNLNTYQLMQSGTPAEVKAAARQCIDDAAEGGRFILTTGDQIGRDTPEENVIAMVEAAYEYGRY